MPLILKSVEVVTLSKRTEPPPEIVKLNMSPLNLDFVNLPPESESLPAPPLIVVLIPLL